VSGECCFVLCFRTEGYLPVPTKQIQSAKVRVPREGVQRLIYPWERVGVLDGSTVELAVIHTEPPATILLEKILYLAAFLGA